VSTLLRVASGIVFVPALILASRAGRGWFLFLAEWILFAGAWEFYLMMEAKGINPSKKVGVGAVLVLGVLTYLGGTAPLGFFLAAFVITITLRELFRAETALPIYDIATTVFGVLYVGWLGVHFVLLRELPREIGTAYSTGSAFLLYAFLMAWSCDTAAYFVGLGIGRHRLFARVSPKKSVEGAIAGFLAAIGGAAWGRAWFVRDVHGEPLLGLTEALVLGGLVGISNQLGDLVESLIKRDADVKDASETIPGHGGILDRFDSLLFSAPVTYWYLVLVVFR
jgi:phosphatidate cytidylyltransferase